MLTFLQRSVQQQVHSKNFLRFTLRIPLAKHLFLYILPYWYELRLPLGISSRVETISFIPHRNLFQAYFSILCFAIKTTTLLYNLNHNVIA